MILLIMEGNYSYTILMSFFPLRKIFMKDTGGITMEVNGLPKQTVKEK